MVAALGLAGTVGVMARCWLAAGAGSAFIWAGLNTLAVQSAPENRGGAISVVGAFKFAGSAVAPLLWLPLYVARDELAFAAGGRRLRADRARRRAGCGGPRRVASPPPTAPGAAARGTALGGPRVPDVSTSAPARPADEDALLALFDEAVAWMVARGQTGPVGRPAVLRAAGDARARARDRREHAGPVDRRARAARRSAR